jgi:hypothetical protein
MKSKERRQRRLGHNSEVDEKIVEAMMICLSRVNQDEPEQQTLPVKTEMPKLTKLDLTMIRGHEVEENRPS